MSKKMDTFDPVDNEGKEFGVGRLRRPFLALSLIAALSGLTACSSVPDAINPAEWYKSTVDFFAGEDNQGQPTEEAKAETTAGKPVPGEDKAFPKLSSVPERPSEPVKGGLVADTENRKYAEPIARQGEAREMLAAAPPSPPAPSAEPSVTPVQPAPPAMPAEPVSQAPYMMPSGAPAPEPLPARSQPNIASIEPKPFTLTPPSSGPALPANSLTSMNDDLYSTVVVSSDGVQMQGDSAAMAPVRPEMTGAPEPQLAATSMPETDSSFAAALQRPSFEAIGGTKVATILFENGSAGLSAHDRSILREVVKLHRQRGGHVTVVGHASSRTRNMDPVRHKMVNYGVSADRAGRIAEELQRMGLDPNAVVVDARSDSMPLYYEIMPSGEAGNRRAEIYFDN